MMKPPRFWTTTRAPFWTFLLSWASVLYAWATAYRLRTIKPHKVGLPVICVGNLSLAGVGKTPIVRDLAEKLSQKKVRVGILSRGYGGRLLGPLRVIPTQHAARDVGDEPLLLATTAPTWVAKNRLVGAQAMAQKGYECILMDDGHQNPHIHKDLSLVVIDAATQFGNGQVFPVGPLREGVTAGLKRAGGIILVGTPSADFLAEMKTHKKPIFCAEMTPDITSLDLIQKYVAFAGIGHPEKFFESMRTKGVQIVDTRSFSDHHPYTAQDIKKLHQWAAHHQAKLLTTEKDFCRLTKPQKKDVFWPALRVKWKGSKTPFSLVMEKIKDA